MMPMTRGNIEILLDSPDERDYVVSAYADLRVKDGFRDFFEQEFRNATRAAGAAIAKAEARKTLDANLEAVRAAVNEQVPAPARGAAVFVSAARGMQDVMALNFPVENRLVIDEEPFVLPLLDQLYSAPSYLVALIDSNHAHIYEAQNGSLDEVDVIGRPDVRMEIQRDKPRFNYKKRFDQTCHEFQHGAEEDQYLKGITETLAHCWANGEFDRLIVIGRSFIHGAMRWLLPKELAAALVEVEPHTTVVSPDEVAAEVARVVEAWHDGRDAEVTHELVQRRQEQYLLAQGPTSVLDALQQGRALLVIVGRSRSISGAVCRDCGYSFGTSIETCVYCGGRCRTVNALQDILRRTLKQRVPVHLFRPGPDPDPVEMDGGVAALLRADANWTPARSPLRVPRRNMPSRREGSPRHPDRTLASHPPSCKNTDRVRSHEVSSGFRIQDQRTGASGRSGHRAGQERFRSGIPTRTNVRPVSGIEITSYFPGFWFHGTYPTRAFLPSRERIAHERVRLTDSVNERGKFFQGDSSIQARCLMSVADRESTPFTLVLNEGERVQLLKLLEQAFRDTHVEARRTESPDYQEQVHHQEAVLRGLIDKLRRD